MPDQLAAKSGSGKCVPSLTRAKAKPIPAPATLAQSIVPWYCATSIPCTWAPPTGPLGRAMGVTCAGVPPGFVPPGFVPPGFVPPGLLVTGAVELDELEPPPEPPHPRRVVNERTHARTRRRFMISLALRRSLAVVVGSPCEERRKVASRPSGKCHPVPR